MFLSKLFRGKKKEAFVIKDYRDFWVWFENNQYDLYRALKSGDPNDFVNLVCEKLDELRPGYYCLAGMMDDITAEFIITADGVIKNFVFVEELVNSAPELNNWKFTAHKPPHKLKDCNINYEGILINPENLHYVYNENEQYPDEINISLVHDDYKGDDHIKFASGIDIFLDLLLGEVYYTTNIDNKAVVRKDEVKKHLIPIAKIKDFLAWREKEFIESYTERIYNAENDTHSTFEATSKAGNPIFLLFNTDVLHWDGKVSHPWILEIECEYNGNDEKLPSNDDLESMEKIEERMINELEWNEGNVYIGRITGENERLTYFACKEFRTPSKIIDKLISRADEFEMSYVIYRDKYWRTFKQYEDLTSI